MKFWELFLRFKQEQAHLKFLNVVFPEFKKSPITTFEARTKIKERRIDEWTKENKEAREVIVSENFENINYNLEMIMNKYKYEVEINNYKPQDFLIITPFTTNNS